MVFKYCNYQAPFVYQLPLKCYSYLFFVVGTYWSSVFDFSNAHLLSTISKEMAQLAGDVHPIAFCHNATPSINSGMYVSIKEYFHHTMIAFIVFHHFGAQALTLLQYIQGIKTYVAYFYLLCTMNYIQC